MKRTRNRPRRDKRNTVEARDNLRPMATVDKPVTQFLAMTSAQRARYADRPCFFADMRANLKPELQRACRPVEFVVILGSEVRLLCHEDALMYADMFDLPMPIIP